MRKVAKGFIAIDQRLYDSDLDIYHINILSWILSYQVQDQPFFMSKIVMAEKFGCNRKTIERRFNDLQSLGIIMKGEKYKRMYKYKVNLHRLDMYLRVPYPERSGTQSTISSKKRYTEYHYKNSTNKTSSNKTSFGVDDLKSSSTQTISENQIKGFLETLAQESI